ncbi:MAG: hypothetical protein PWQ84_1600 [Thermotogaceae bacterium]|jgi:hypothetical protein|nr:hypothetical protein [Thermotogaceae bacterium]
MNKTQIQQIHKKQSQKINDTMLRESDMVEALVVVSDVEWAEDSSAEVAEAVLDEAVGKRFF